MKTLTRIIWILILLDGLIVGCLLYTGFGQATATDGADILRGFTALAGMFFGMAVLPMLFYRNSLSVRISGFFALLPVVLCLSFLN
jgi:uncharacterized membrane protein